MLSFLLFDEQLLDVVRDEVQEAWSQGSLDVKSLCANSPNLNAIFHETLRLRGGSMIAREVVSQTSLGGKKLQPGNTVIIPGRLLHKNQEVWGKYVDDFQPRRFKEKKHLARHPSYRPFGGGSTYCPGRVLAKEEVFGFLGILLHRFHIKLANDAKRDFPRLNTTMPSLGITGPMDGDDVMAEVTL